MPQIKAVSSHKPCTAYIQRYLEHDERALDRSFFGVPREHREQWAAWFDAIRHSAGNDTPLRGKDPVTYQHLIISPDPRDEVDLMTLKRLVSEWYAENFLAEDGIGDYPCAVIYHDDNENQIAHAHLIVNNTIPGIKRKLHITNSDNVRMNRSLQRLAFKYGLSFFPTFDRTPDEAELAGRDMPDVQVGGPKVFVPIVDYRRGQRLTRAESAMLHRGVIPWKEKLRNAIDVAVARSTSDAEFSDTLLSLGVMRERRDGGEDIYYPTNRPECRVRGARLGDDYSNDAVSVRIGDTRLDWDTADEGGTRLRQKAENVMGDHDALWLFYLNAEGVDERYLESGVTAREIALMERVTGLEHVTSQEGYDERIAALEAELSASGESMSRFEVREIRRRIEALSQARDVAEAIGAFADVEPVGEKRTFAQIDSEIRALIAQVDPGDMEERLKLSRLLNENREQWARAREQAKAMRASDQAPASGDADSPVADETAARVARPKR